MHECDQRVRLDGAVGWRGDLADGGRDMNEYTPRPWSFGKFATNDGQRAVMAGSEPDRKRVALVDCQTEHKRGKGYDVNCPEREANARLISAAPEMHQWLTAHYALEEGPGQTDRPQYAALKALLNKIKGYA